MTIEKSEMLEWLNGQLCKAEKSVLAREQGARSWRGGTTAIWRAVGCKLNKSERFALADREDRIAVKYRNDVKVLQAIIYPISHVDVSSVEFDLPI